MDELVKTFHIDWKLMIAQIVNFAVVLAVLWRFALKPLQKLMSERAHEIDKSLQQAKDIERKLAEADKTTEQTIMQAKKESQAIITEANQEADKIRQVKMAELKEEMAKVVVDTKATLQNEKAEMVKQAKSEVADMVINVSSKIVGRNMNTESNKKFINQSISKE